MDRVVLVRLILWFVVRGYKKAQQAAVDHNVSGQTVVLCARHGAHAMSVAAVLEVGGPKGWSIAAEHECSIPGLFSCPDEELSPFSYGTRARNVMGHAEKFEDHVMLNAMPAAQFVFRVEEYFVRKYEQVVQQNWAGEGTDGRY